MLTSLEAEAAETATQTVPRPAYRSYRAVVSRVERLTPCFTRVTFTGDERANSGQQVLGRADFDPRNRNDENDSNTGEATGNNLGTFGTNMARLSLNDAVGTAFPQTFDPARR